MNALLRFACAIALLPQASPSRPRDPWILRTALDARPRAVVLALDQQLWAAYDAATCGLYRVWSGDVDFDDERAPKTRGAIFTEASQGAVWWVEEKGKAQLVDATFRGYAVQGGHVVLHYELRTQSGAVIRVDETPEFERPEELDAEPTNVAPWLTRDLVGLRRSFKASGIPEGVRLSLTVRARCVGYVDYDRILPEGERTFEESGVQLRELFARLVIESATASHEIHFFFSPKAATPVSAVK